MYKIPTRILRLDIRKNYASSTITMHATRPAATKRRVVLLRRHPGWISTATE